jgi:hypothetical protein
MRDDHPCTVERPSSVSRRTGLPIAAAVVGMCLGLAACSSGAAEGPAQPPVPTTTSTTIPLKSVGLISARPFVRDRVVLTKHTVRAGTTIAGTLIVTNASSSPVNLTSECEPDYAVVIRNRTVQQEPAFTTGCSSQPLILHPGANRFPISVTTTYFECLPPGGTSVSPLPKCSPDGPPSLPAGRDTTVLFGSGDLALPEPAPVNVRLTE